MGKKNIVIIDDSIQVIKALAELLKSDYNISFATDGIKGMELIEKKAPDLILLDIMMEPINGYEVCKRIKSNIKIKDIPVIFVTAISEAMDEAKAFEAGGADYITKPFVPIVVKARVQNHIQLSSYMIELKELYKVALDANPITGLPGNNTIHKTINEHLDNKLDSTIFYIDLDHFKSYNDVYGFAKGDEIILFTKDLIKSVGTNLGIKRTFYGHIGGDDFIVIVPKKYALKYAKELIKQFDQKILNFYNEEDLKLKTITAKDRSGETVTYPITAISLGGLHLLDFTYNNYIEVNDSLTEMKKQAKSLVGSSVFIERRRNK